LLIEIADPGALPISVLQGLLKAQDWIANRSARQALVRIVTREDIPVLKEMLNSEVEYLQWAASEALVEVVEREDIPALREMLRSEDERVQWVAAESLGQVVEREDVPDLREMLEDDDEYVHWAAAKALARLAEQEDIPDLEIMLKDKDPDARRAAIQALGRVAGQDAIPHILEMLPDKDRKVWHTAVTVLLQISKQMGREALPILRTLVRALSVFEEFDSEHRDKLWAAAELLAQIEGREALPYVQEIVGRMGSLDARIDLRRIAQVLRQMGQEATPDLLLLLREAGGPMQEAAAWALAQVAETESAVDWRDFLKVRYLPWLGESQVLEALEKFVAEDDLTELAEWVACHAAAGGGGVACSLLIHLDRRLYCPFDLEWVELPLFPPSHVLAPVSDV
jgi:HEAT repeat protein